MYNLLRNEEEQELFLKLKSKSKSKTFSSPARSRYIVGNLSKEFDDKLEEATTTEDVSNESQLSVINLTEMKQLLERDSVIKPEPKNNRPETVVKRKTPSIMEKDLSQLWSPKFWGKPLSELLHKLVTREAASYNQLVSWKSTRIFTSFNEDLVDESNQVKNRVTSLISDSYELKCYVHLIEDGVAKICEMYSVEPFEDPTLESVTSELKALKKTAISNISSKCLFNATYGLRPQITDNTELKDGLINLMTRLCLFEVYKSDHAELNDWLDSEKLVTKAFQLGNKTLNSVIITKQTSQKGASSDVVSDVKIFKAILDLHADEILLNGEVKWLNVALARYLKKLAMKVLTLEEAMSKLKTDWRNNSSVNIQVIAHEQEKAFRELLQTKNFFKFCLLSDYTDDLTRQELKALCQKLGNDAGGVVIGSKQALIKARIADRAKKHVEDMRSEVKISAVLSTNEMWQSLLSTQSSNKR